MHSLDTLGVRGSNVVLLIIIISSMKIYKIKLLNQGGSFLSIVVDNTATVFSASCQHSRSDNIVAAKSNFVVGKVKDLVDYSRQHGSSFSPLRQDSGRDN
jgi:hypothetical protein